MSRSLQFMIFSDPDIRVTNVGLEKKLAFYKCQLEDSSVYMSIFDGTFLEHPNRHSYTAEIFRNDDPTAFLHPPK